MEIVEEKTPNLWRSDRFQRYMEKEMAAESPEKRLKKEMAAESGRDQAPTKKKMKKTAVAKVGKDYIEYMMKHPPSPPRPEWGKRYVAQQKAKLARHRRMLVEYEVRGFALTEVELPDEVEV